MLKVFTRLVAAIAALALVAQPAAAQSVLRDAETEAVLDEMAAPLIRAAGLEPANVKMVLIGDPSINAFVAGGQIVYMHSGTIMEAANANEVQGVIAHELGHITGGHIIRSSEGIKQATGITLLTLLAGIAAAAAGAGDAGMGIMAAGQQAALGRYLAFSRTQESSADAAGVAYLEGAGVSGKGSLAFFERIQNLEYRLAIPQEDSYGRTHPLSGERLTVLEHQYKSSPNWDRPTNPSLEARFQRVRAKLKGFANDPQRTLREFPERVATSPARYARAYAFHRSAYPERALKEVDALLASAPDDPYYLELKGQILLESGRPAEALPMLREAVQRTRSQPLIAALFGHALIATDDPKNFAEARDVLRAAIAKDNDNPFAWYQLGVVYAREGDTPRAMLATAERYNLQRQPQLALANARQAMVGIKEGTPDWLRAQDIALVAEGEVERMRKNGGRERPRLRFGGEEQPWPGSGPGRR